jgi:hypothetical protein|tara:strand:+ start:160 stop:294 length:135 start_codon:yes stop_codon:yes gene_type:complete
MHNQKRKIKKRKKIKTFKKSEPYGYQPDNPLTIYYKKYIEKDKS